MADTFPLAAVGNPAAEFANKSKSVANKVLAVACNQWSAVRYTLTLWTDFRPCIPTTSTWYICALLAAVKRTCWSPCRPRARRCPTRSTRFQQMPSR